MPLFFSFLLLEGILSSGIRQISSVRLSSEGFNSSLPPPVTVGTNSIPSLLLVGSRAKLSLVGLKH